MANHASDSRPPSVGWTSQSDVPQPVDHFEVPGNTVKASELPDPEVQRAAGVNPALWRTTSLYVEDDDVADE